MVYSHHRLKRIKRQYFKDFNDFDNFQPVDPNKFTLTSSTLTLYDVPSSEKDKLSTEQIQEKCVTETKTFGSEISSGEFSMNSCHGDGCVDGRDCISTNESESFNCVSTTSERNTAVEMDSCDLSLSDTTTFKETSSLTSAFLNSEVGTPTEMCQSRDVSVCSSQTDCISPGSEDRDPNCFPSTLIQSVNAAINAEQDSTMYTTDSNKNLKHVEASCHTDSDICVSISSSGYCGDTCPDSGSASGFYMLPRWPDNQQMCSVTSKKRELHLDLGECDLTDHILCSDSDVNLDCNACDSNTAAQEWSPGSGSITCHLGSFEPIISSPDVTPPQVYYGTGSDYIYMQ